MTTSGMCSAEPLNCTIAALGHERIMFGADYPFEKAEEAGHFIDSVPLSDDVRADICFKNAEKFFGLKNTGKTIMSGPNDRITTAISTKELERRWAAARKEMRERGIDALVMQNNSDWLGGYVKWFTDIPATNAYPEDRGVPRQRPDDPGRDGRLQRRAQSQGRRSGASRHRRRDRLAVVLRGELHRQLPRRLHPPRPEEARLRHHRAGRPRQPAARLRHAAEGRAVRHHQVRRRDRVHRPPEGDQERGRDRPDQALLRDAGRDLRQGRVEHQTRHARHRRDRARRIRRAAARQRARHLPRLVGAGRSAGALRAAATSRAAPCRRATTWCC